MDDTSILDDTEQYVSKSHSKLLEAVSQLDKGQRVKKVERSEPTLEVSEFHLVKSGISDQDTVHVQEIARILRKKGHHIEIARNIETAKKNIRVLPKPLEKPAAERIKRIVGFEGTKKELKKNGTQ
ncbi:U3 small nucleolar RNA-associated protein 14 homolog A-like [Ceratina calcarata]|uniref:U3 small nucleolar RNA-associated protein 14 homolog A-like n=1 Tax=Ceratina calcarata TaxID=156304 RepID=A0AAJ7JFP5_9HYME|nr:U3 small nucleolar RNA-associated protein 14 homolog A-like [Ceratina calcarata]